MNTFLYVLVGWIIVLYLVNKVREKYSKPKTVNILVKRKWRLSRSGSRSDASKP